MEHQALSHPKHREHVVANHVHMRSSAARDALLRVGLVAVFLGVTVATVGLKASAAEPARLQETAYNVELVIFRALTPLGIAEDWSAEGLKGRSALPAESDTGSAEVSDQGTPLAVSTMSPALFKLAAVESSLQRSRGYQVVGHIGWTQIAVPRGSGLSVDLSDVGLNGVPVRGSGALERGKYAYLRLNLAYTPSDPPASLVGTVQHDGPVTFFLSQVRRVRPFERHYFDHPAFGVIAMISPVS